MQRLNFSIPKLGHRSNAIFLGILLLVYSLVLIKTAWIGDDAFITFRTVDNFVNGFGPLWHLSERVQAYTHPLWMFCLSLAYFFSGELYYTTIALSILLSVVTAFLVCGRIAASGTSAAMLLILLILSKSFIDYSTSGLENPLTHLLAALFFIGYLHLLDGKELTTKWLILTALFAGLSVVNRMDTALLYGPALLFLAWQTHSLKRATLLLIGSIPVVLWELFSLFYYGFLFPNTAYAKLNAGISQSDMIYQGILYLLNAISVDPVTPLAILVGILWPLLIRRRSLLPLSLGIVLYVIYVVRIGGDFMTGRFWAAPFFIAVLLLSTFDFARLKSAELLATYALIFFVGLANPSQSPVFSNAEYNKPLIDSAGIADERGHYYQRYGLLTANRVNRLPEQGARHGETGPFDFVNDNPGWRGFVASRYTYIVDPLALTNPLLARLPAAYTPDWRIGHMKRAVPPGYVGTLRTGQNMIQDPSLATYYAKLKSVVSDPLLAPGRLTTIWGFLIGEYDYLVDADRYRFPDMEHFDLAENGLATGQDTALNSHEFNIAHRSFMPSMPITHQGVQFSWAQPIHATHLDIGFECSTDGCEYFRVAFFQNDQRLDEYTVDIAPIRYGADQSSVVPVPQHVIEKGFNQLRVTPLRMATYQLNYLNLVNTSQSPALSSAVPERVKASMESLVHLYVYSHYYAEDQRSGGRAAILAQLNDYLTNAPVEGWSALPVATTASLLLIPDPALQALIWSRLPDQQVLVDPAGEPKLRYFGGEIAKPERDYQGMAITLYFEVLNPLEKEYSAWVHLKGRQVIDEQTGALGDASEWIVYDHFPFTPTDQWEMGTITPFVIDVEMVPGEYEISTGLWTPHVRERLYHQDNPETYWLNLEPYTIPVSDVEP